MTIFSSRILDPNPHVNVCVNMLLNDKVYEGGDRAIAKSTLPTLYKLHFSEPSRDKD